MDWGQDWIYKRARRLNAGDEITSYLDLIWPTTSPAGPGRANASGSPLLYLADRTETAHSETGVENDDVLLALFQVRPGRSYRVLPIGEFAYIQRSGRGRLVPSNQSAMLDNMLNACDRNEAMAYLIVDSFLHDCLVEDEKPYSLSSYICDLAFKKYPRVSAISYPSVQRSGSINFAVKTENFWETWGILSASKYRAEHLAQGFFSTSERTNVTGIRNDGDLIWDSEIVAPDLTHRLAPLWIPSNFRSN
ncbi:RES domain-containing protein [Paraherbaspirillum soli]|uniref:RES domain-containing protein n=1 Tax=Paraherbaspirillum soli TaxID=631222 RepID=A0ABW0MB19_9BURK